MAILTDSPQIEALKAATEKKLGHSVKSRSDFTYLASEIERVTREHLSENTLRRLWGAIKGYDTVFTRTLDVMCKYTGYENWDTFINHLNKQSNQSVETSTEHSIINPEDLKIGDRIRIGWLPDRVCIIEYAGRHTFRAIDCKNAIIQVGDTFECKFFLKDYPLFVDNLVHGGELCQKCALGLPCGLITGSPAKPCVNKIH